MLESIPYTTKTNVISHANFRASRPFSWFEAQQMVMNPSMFDGIADDELRFLFTKWMLINDIPFQFCP